MVKNSDRYRTGPLIQIGTAIETASEMKRAYPRFYSGA